MGKVLSSTLGGILALALTAGMVPAAVTAKPPLREVREITDALLWVGLADEIRKKCDRIDGRVVKGLLTLNAIRNRAEALGYSDAEIEAYRKSDTEKAVLRERGEAYLQANGVDLGVKTDYCTLGRAEIEKNSQIGVLLKAK